MMLCDISMQTFTLRMLAASASPSMDVSPSRGNQTPRNGQADALGRSWVIRGVLTHGSGMKVQQIVADVLYTFFVFG